MIGLPIIRPRPMPANAPIPPTIHVNATAPGNRSVRIVNLTNQSIAMARTPQPQTSGASRTETACSTPHYPIESEAPPYLSPKWRSLFPLRIKAPKNPAARVGFGRLGFHRHIIRRPSGAGASLLGSGTWPKSCLAGSSDGRTRRGPDFDLRLWKENAEAVKLGRVRSDQHLGRPDSFIAECAANP